MIVERGRRGGDREAETVAGKRGPESVAGNKIGCGIGGNKESLFLIRTRSRNNSEEPVLRFEALIM
jgi:hypothetical protein